MSEQEQIQELKEILSWFVKYAETEDYFSSLSDGIEILAKAKAALQK